MWNKGPLIAIIVVLLTTIAPGFARAASYQALLTPDEMFMKVVYPKGSDPIAKKLAVVYYVPKEHGDSTIGKVRAFAVYRPKHAAIRLDLKDVVTEDLSHPLCGDTTKFELPLPNASVTRTTPNAIPQLVLFGTGVGSAGFTNISIYTLSPTWLNDTRNKSMCAAAQLEKECTDWALKQEAQSRVRYDRWMRAESIDDIKYVIRQVRGK